MVSPTHWRWKNMRASGHLIPGAGVAVQVNAGNGLYGAVVVCGWVGAWQPVIRPSRGMQDQSFDDRSPIKRAE